MKGRLITDVATMGSIEGSIFQIVQIVVQWIHRELFLQIVYYKKSTGIFSLGGSHPRWIERRGKEGTLLQTFLLQLTFEIISQLI